MTMLPDELVLEIFSWLPAKVIYKFKSVNKFFSTIPSAEPYFSLKQSQNSLLKNDSCFFLQPNTLQRFSAITEFHHLPSEKPFSGVPDNFLQFLKNYPACRIIASSNGLIIGRSTKQREETKLFISNPATQSWLPISAPDYLKEYPDFEINIAFECNFKSLGDSNDFMLFLFKVPTEWSSHYDLKFYSQKAGMWKTIEKSFITGARSMRFDMHVYHNKALHFISDCFPYIVKKSTYFRPYIMAYNIEDGESRMLRVPKEARRGSHDHTCQMGIYKWGKVTSSEESICLVRLRKSVFTLWVLTDYESNRWRRVLKIRVKAMGMMEEEPIIVIGFTVMNGDCLVFATRKKVYRYGLTQESYMKLEEICEHGFEDYYKVCFTSYSDTLRPCGGGATTLPLLQQPY